MEPPRRVGLVEDHDVLRSVLEHMIRSCGYDCTSFECAEEFLTESAPREFGCLVVDLGLPGMSGLQLEANLRRLGVTTPFILTTGYDPSSIPTIGGSRLVAVLWKPFGFHELETALRDAFEDGGR